MSVFQIIIKIIKEAVFITYVNFSYLLQRITSDSFIKARLIETTSITIILWVPTRFFHVLVILRLTMNIGIFYLYRCSMLQPITKLFLLVFQENGFICLLYEPSLICQYYIYGLTFFLHILKNRRSPWRTLCIR